VTWSTSRGKGNSKSSLFVVRVSRTAPRADDAEAAAVREAG
jgi:hypothetical protein